jgi:hypothetical protein
MSDDDDSKPWTSADEHNLLLEISEDNRLRNIGINPDQSDLDILIDLLWLEAKDKEALADKQQPHTTDKI